MSRLVFEKDLPEVLTRAQNLPSLPAVALEVLCLTQDEDCTVAELARCLSRDPVLSARLLKLANSSLFSPRCAITTLHRATMTLGMKTVKLMSLSFSLVDSIPRKGHQGGFDYGVYWRRSLVAAVAARSLAKLVGSKQADEAFLCGLLAHFGRLVLARTMPEEYGQATSELGEWPTPAQEEERLGFSNTDVCATLLKSWDLPALIYMAAGYWSRTEDLPEDVDPETIDLVRLIEVTALAESVLCDEEKAEPLARLHKRAWEYYELQESEVDSFLIGLETGISETAEMLAIQQGGNSHQEILDQARLQIVNVSLGAVVDLRLAERNNESLEEEVKRLGTRAMTDALTGLRNRAAFDEFIAKQISKRVNRKEPRALGLILLDIDRFKSFNDTYGHQAGDEVLRMVGGVLSRTTRKADLAARYGGEEFAVVVPHTTTFGMKALSERLRKAIENETLELEGETLRVTASFGGACIVAFQSKDDARLLIKLADHYLYKAKRNGRNCSEIHPHMRLPDG